MKKRTDWIPHRDGDFDKFQKNFVTKVAGSPAVYGLDPADVAPLTIAQGTWTTMFATHITIHKDAKAAAVNKDDSKEALMTVMRDLTQRVEADPTVTDDARKQAGMSVHDKKKTPVPVPETRPVAEIGTKERLQHTLRIRDEGSKERSKPFGVRECEIWVKIGDPAPADLDDCKFIGPTSRFSYVVKYKGGDGGKTAHYLLRWMNNRGAAGPLSEVHSAVIPA